MPLRGWYRVVRFVQNVQPTAVGADSKVVQVIDAVAVHFIFLAFFRIHQASRRHGNVIVEIPLVIGVVFEDFETFSDSLLDSPQTERRIIVKDIF